jgi:phage-related protein (TIGR01555 family)
MKRSERRAQLRKTNDTKAVATNDSYQNFLTRTGLGAGNTMSGGHYSFNWTSKNRQQLDAMYRSSWIVGKAVDAVAEDMTREGIEIHSSADPSDIEAFQAEWKKLQVWDRISDTIKWGRLYGGAIGILLIDGQDFSTPLRIEAVGRDQFKGLFVLDRWLVQPSLNDTITELGPDLGMPKYYDIPASTYALSGQRVHHSRVVRIDGQDLPVLQRQTESGFGQSVIERLYERLLCFDSTTLGTAQLAHRAHLRTLSVDGLRDIISAGGPELQGLVKHIEMMRLYQSNEGISLIDTADKFEAHQFSFSGLSDVLLMISQQLSGSLNIPLVRLLGQSPSGLNSSGESEIRTYFDGINTEQERRLRTPMDKILQISWRSKFGTAPPEGTSFEFAPLWTLSDTEKATVATNIVNAVTTAMDHGIIDRPTAMRELRQSSRIIGVFSNITDEAIEEAEQEPPPIPEAGEPEQPVTEDAANGGDVE